MADVKAHLQELVSSLREFASSLTPSQYIEHNEEVFSTINDMLDSIKELKAKYERCLEMQVRIKTLQENTENNRNMLKIAYNKLNSSISALKTISPDIELTEISAWDIVNLARQFPLTQHSFPNEEQIQFSMLRRMPYNKQDRMPVPIVEPDPDAKDLPGAEISINPPKELPATYRNNSYIMYTMDESVPTSVNGIRYDPTNKPTINKNMMLRAVLCHPGKFDSEIAERVYILDENDTSLFAVLRKKPELVRPEEIKIRARMKLSETPSVETPRPPSNNPYILPISTGSIHAPTPGRQGSVYLTSSPEEIL